METALAQLHRAEAALMGEFEGCTLAESFAPLEQEFAAAKERVAVFDTSWHATLRLTGRDRVNYLHAITSNDIKGLEAGRGTLALLLNPQGRILSELEIFVLADSALIRTHASARERTAATLKKFIIASDVKIEDLTDIVGSVAVEGPRAPVVIEQACGVKIPEVPLMSIREVAVEGISCELIRRSHFGAPGAELLAKREAMPALWSGLLVTAGAHGGEPIGMKALNALRLEAGVPWYPADFNEAMIPHEAGVETTHISFNKGCYTGQEIVERVRSRGQVNRKRVRLKFSTMYAPTAGTKLRAIGTGVEVGFVTSAAAMPNDQTAIGMGYVRREQFSPGSVVEFDGGTATVMPVS
jgi:folate-binding protein YgfZ